MKFIPTKLKGVFIIETPFFNDLRGVFSKTFHKDSFQAEGLCAEFRESYYSSSKRGVIRGMHFQMPPHEHEKLVYVPKGKILDVILDLRNGETYGEYISLELSGDKGNAIYIPKGLAHGFKSLEEDTITVYNVSTVYNSDADSGVSYDSFGFDWECESPTISDRDRSFLQFKEVRSPF